MASAASSSVRPSAVQVNSRPPRISSFAPTASSSAARRRLTVELSTCSSRAAPATEPARASASRTLKSLHSGAMRPSRRGRQACRQRLDFCTRRLQRLGIDSGTGARLSSRATHSTRHPATEGRTA